MFRCNEMHHCYCFKWYINSKLSWYQRFNVIHIYTKGVPWLLNQSVSLIPFSLPLSLFVPLEVETRRGNCTGDAATGWWWMQEWHTMGVWGLPGNPSFSHRPPSRAAPVWDPYHRHRRVFVCVCLLSFVHTNSFNSISRLRLPERRSIVIRPVVYRITKHTLACQPPLSPAVR